jgi:hypothetical protein
LAANVAVAEPSAVGRLIAGWPSCALIGSYELLMGQIRHASVRGTERESTIEPMRHMNSDPFQMNTETPDTAPAANAAPSYDTHTEPAFPPKNPGDARADQPARPLHLSGGVAALSPAGAGPRHWSHSGNEGGTSEVRYRAWQWAVANRGPEGDLPPGKAIAAQFGRSERWGRLVKNTGLRGRLDPSTAE